MSKTPQEWLKQADYDMETAKFMFDGKRYFYAVFMCHLAIEKALKGLLKEKLKEEPPKVHNLRSSLIFPVKTQGHKYLSRPYS